MHQHVQRRNALCMHAVRSELEWRSSQSRLRKLALPNVFAFVRDPHIHKSIRIFISLLPTFLTTMAKSRLRPRRWNDDNFWKLRVITTTTTQVRTLTYYLIQIDWVQDLKSVAHVVQNWYFPTARIEILVLFLLIELVHLHWMILLLCTDIFKRF